MPSATDPNSSYIPTRHGAILLDMKLIRLWSPFGLLLFIAIGYSAFLSTLGGAPSASESLNHVTGSATFTFIRRDGTCVTGRIAKADTKSMTIQPFGLPPITLERGSLLQVIQGNALLFSARSSWADVASVHVYPHEVLVLKIRSAKEVRGAPLKVTPGSISLKHALGKTVYPKADIDIVDYLRVKPATDSFMSTLDEFPYALFLEPEFYYRVAGLEGRIRVRLYDASKPEDDSPVNCSGR